ncbi:hypothetical protein Tco_0893177 [Tanacetum coccineum]|uniref:Aminotransferase-like plant mobile domain-containing protein n=1 Tax=Tanacetum coccineum TaxID=301880 RepID=A0ABQ5C8I5_9ASTR
MISVNNLKTDSEKDNEKVIPLIPSPEPAISCFDDLDFFKDFENEFPTIVYNDVQTSKLDLLTEPTLNLQHIDELNLNDETSMSEYDEEEQNILYFNDLFSFNIIRPDDLKSEKDNDNNEIDIIQSLEDNEITHGSTRLFETSHDKITKYMALPPHEQRHQFIRVQVFDFGGLPDLMVEELSVRMLMEHRDDQGCEAGPRQGGLRDYWTGISSVGDFLGTTPSYTMIQDPILGTGKRVHRSLTQSLIYWLGILRLLPLRGRTGLIFAVRYAFVALLAEHFGILTAEILGGLTVIAPELPIIDMAELVRLQICAKPPISAPEQAPQQPPPLPLAAARTVPQRLGRLEEDVQGLRRDVGSLRGLVERSMTDQGRFSTWMIDDIK